MNNDSKSKFELHIARGIKMETPASKFLTFSIGASILIFSAAAFVLALGKSGLI